VLKVPFSALSEWNQSFDEHMRPLKIPDRRGKVSKISPDMVRVIVREAAALKAQGKKLRIKSFTRQLKMENDIFLSRKTVKEVLIANDLFAASTRKRRPGFYMSIRKQIPNGLVSLDGSELCVLVDETPYKFNVELCVDVNSFAHTAFSVGDSENSDEIIRVLETHIRTWGGPLGILCDHGSSNLSEQTRDYLKKHDIELVPVGPGNPKGNGTDEGAFSHMKRALGTIHLDTSSPKALARTVLEKMISLYVSMRNRIPSKAGILTPQQTMKSPVDQDERALEQQRLKDFNMRRKGSGEDKEKQDRLLYLIRQHGICPDNAALKRAERTIKAFELKTIGAAEAAFLKAVARNPQKTTLPYFFGTLKNIQNERDDAAYKNYCYDRYNEQTMLKLRQQQEQPEQPDYSIENIIGILVQAISATITVVKELAIKKARQWTNDLMELHLYPGALKKRFSDAIGALTELTIDQKNRIWELIEQFLDAKIATESVTQFS
jgi:hypothetical protein